MLCYVCGCMTKVTDSRYYADRGLVRRRRLCRNGHRFSTVEEPISNIRSGKPVEKASELAKKITIKRLEKRLLDLLND